MNWFSKLRARLTRTKAIDLAEPATEEWEVVTERARADMDARRRVLAPLSAIVAEISAALHAQDPIGLGKRADDDEYDSEAETIVLRLSDQRHLAAVDEVQKIVHEEFVRWFGEDLAGPRDRYVTVAADVHRLWGEYLADDQ